jgi:Translin family
MEAFLPFGKPLLKRLEETANQHPYYKYNGFWSRQMESLSFCTVYMRWLGLIPVPGDSDGMVPGRLLTYEQVAKILQSMFMTINNLMEVPTDEDDNKFHLSIEEYLHSVISLINELVIISRVI